MCGASTLFACLVTPDDTCASSCLTSEILALFASTIDGGKLLFAVGTGEPFFIPQTAACVPVLDAD